MNDDLAVAEDRTRFEEAHPPLTMELTDDEGESVEVPTERLPRLLFWHVLLRPWVPPKKTKGGIILADQVADANEYHVPCYQVLKLGPLAFTHPRLRGGGRIGERREWHDNDVVGKIRWIETESVDTSEGQYLPSVGDWVLIKQHCGIRWQLLGANLRLVSDDDIIAVIDSPTGWKSYI